MANKPIGYILLAIGAIIIALSYKTARASIGLNLPSILNNDNYLLIAGAAIVIVGAIVGFTGSSSKKQAEEVPIYEGEGKNRTIVGYRKLK